MRYTLDAEFIDTLECSALISLALVNEDMDFVYFEFDYPREHLTPWLRQNVVPNLHARERHTAQQAARIIEGFIGPKHPEFWAYFGAYDWYWFNRLWGGLMSTPASWPNLYHELALQRGYGRVWTPPAVPHNALNDARAAMAALNALGDPVPL